MAQLRLFGKNADGRVTQVPEEDADLSRYRWQVRRKLGGYEQVSRNWLDTQGKWRVAYLSRVIWERHHGPIPPGLVLDHRNGDNLDNSLENLRLATMRQNQQNRKPNHGTASGRKGVSWHKQGKCWTAQICIEGRLRHLGRYKDVEAAARAYDEAARAIFGEFARTNDP